MVGGWWLKAVVVTVWFVVCAIPEILRGRWLDMSSEERGGKLKLAVSRTALFLSGLNVNMRSDTDAYITLQSLR
jgi:hypothetical protein